MQFGSVITRDCVTDSPPQSNLCNDPVYAALHPDQCGAAARLVVRPAIGIVCSMGELQFGAFLIQNNTETDVTKSSVWTSSDPSIIAVGAASGQGVGVAAGSAVVTASYEGLAGSASVEVIASDEEGDCCGNITSAAMVLVDNSKSMSLIFSSAYATKLSYAKHAAETFIRQSTNVGNSIGLISFNGSGSTTLSALSSDEDAVADLVAGINQTQQTTSFLDAVNSAVTELNAASVDRRIIYLITDGEDTSEDGFDAAGEALLEFKNSGGILVIMGVRAWGDYYTILSNLATGGFFANAHAASEEDGLNYLNSIKSILCLGVCIPAGDIVTQIGQLNYFKFSHWDVLDGTVDLVGNGFRDYAPDEVGLYVDLLGSAETPNYSGEMVLNQALSVVGGRPYKASFRIGGNQRQNKGGQDAVTIMGFKRAGDAIAAPTPSAGVAEAGAPITAESYEYAISYLNAQGETSLSAYEPATVTTSDATVTLTWAIGSFPAGQEPTLTRVWRKHVDTDGDEIPILIGTVDPAVNTFDDTLRNAGIDAAISSGTLVWTIRPPTLNLSATRIPYFTEIVKKPWNGPFSNLDYNFTPAADGELILSVTHNDAGLGNVQDATIGMMLSSVAVTSPESATLFGDNFDDENIDYVPPACGNGTVYWEMEGGGYGYAIGGYCDDPVCWDQPPPIQQPDPNPLADVETGAPLPPPTTYSSTQTACADCSLVDPTKTYEIFENAVESSTWAVNNSPALPSPSNVMPRCDVVVPSSYSEVMFYLKITDIQFASTDVADHWVKMRIGQWSTAPGAELIEGDWFGDDVIIPIQREWLATTGELIFMILVPQGTFLLQAGGGSIDAPNFTAYVGESGSTVQSITGTLYAIVSPSEPICSSASATSSVSQADADEQARLAATQAANARVLCAELFESIQTAQATCPLWSHGDPVSRTASYTSYFSQEDADENALEAAQAAADSAIDCTQSNNDEQIGGSSGPTSYDGSAGRVESYPSTKYVSGLDTISGILNVTVNVYGLSCPVPDDIHIVLRSPAGTLVSLMRNAGGAIAASNVDLLFSQGAGSTVPDAGPMVSGTFRPSNYGSEAAMDFITGPFSTSLATLTGEAKNGAWNLLVWDDTNGNVIELAGGWDITIT